MTPWFTDTPVLHTERLTLRAFQPRDMEAGIAFLMDARTRYMGGPYTRAGAWDHCAALVGHWVIRGYGIFVICLKSGDTPVGDIGVQCPGGYPEPELGWGIWDPALEGKGLVREAAEAVRTHAYTALGMTTLVSYIDPDNARSIALARRLGATLDQSARLPDLPDWEGTLTFRHPTPADLGLAPGQSGDST